MPDNRKAIVRYKILDKCLNDRYHNYYIEDLVFKCNEALEDMGVRPVSKRQIQSDIAFMKSSIGYNAPIVSIQNGKRKYIRYSEDFSIMETPITEMEIEQLETLITSLSRFQTIPIYNWVDANAVVPVKKADNPLYEEFGLARNLHYHITLL